MTGRPVQTIYMDHAATTPLSPDALSAMQPFFAERFGNASSIYSLGQDARQAVDQARQRCAAVLNARPSEIVFTSGGTESDNAALMGAAIALRERGNHIVTTRIEHHAVLNAAELLEKLGFDVTYVSPGRDGVVSPEAIEAALTPATSVVSVMLANNETGVIQPIAAITERVKRIATEQRRTIVMHTDAVQAAGYLSLDVDALGVDLLSLSAHKFNGPKGVGALWVRRSTRLTAQTTGGKQERNRRAGTENVPAIVGLGTAARLALDKASAETNRVAALRDRLERGILAGVPDTLVNGDPAQRVANTCNISFARVEAESLLIALDLDDIAVSTGSACSSGSLEPSHVLRAMGFSPHRTQNSIRFSLGLGNTADEVDRVVEVLPAIVDRLRALTRRGPSPAAVER